MDKSRRTRRTFTPEFKHQLVQLYKNGKRKCDIIKEYDIAYSTLDKWIQKENLTTMQEKLAEFQEQTQQLLIEKNILKQAVLIIGEK